MSIIVYFLDFEPIASAMAKMDCCSICKNGLILCLDFCGLRLCASDGFSRSTSFEWIGTIGWLFSLCDFRISLSLLISHFLRSKIVSLKFRLTIFVTSSVRRFTWWLSLSVETNLWIFVCKSIDNPISKYFSKICQVKNYFETMSTSSLPDYFFINPLMLSTWSKTIYYYSILHPSAVQIPTCSIWPI